MEHRHAARFRVRDRMRSFVLALSLVIGTSAAAAPKKRAPPPAAKKAPAATPPASRPNLNLENAQPAAPQGAVADAPVPQRGPTRIDFDDRLIQGQTNKSGAVYLYDRKELKTRSMIKKRESFREEIVGSLDDV